MHEKQWKLPGFAGMFIMTSIILSAGPFEYVEHKLYALLMTYLYFLLVGFLAGLLYWTIAAKNT